MALGGAHRGRADPPAKPAEALDPSLLGASDWLIPNESEFALLSNGTPSEEPPRREGASAGRMQLTMRRLFGPSTRHLQVGRLWNALADHFIRLNQFEKAR